VQWPRMPESFFEEVENIENWRVFEEGRNV
jgi:hypothetical protein